MSATLCLLTLTPVFGQSSDSAAPEVLVSRQLAERASLTVGDVVTLATDEDGTRATTFRVAGVYEPTPDPMRFNQSRIEARLHLPDLVALTAGPASPSSSESLSAINLTLAPSVDMERFRDEFARKSPGLIARATGESAATRRFAVIERFHLAIAAVTVLGSTAFLLALMVIRAEERRDTVGMLRLIGISQRSILLEVVAEGIMVAVAGAALGVLLAASAQYGINRYFQARYDTTLIFVQVTPSIALRCLAIALPVGVIGGVVASWNLLRRRSVLVGR